METEQLLKRRSYSTRQTPSGGRTGAASSSQGADAMDVGLDAFVVDQSCVDLDAASADAVLSSFSPAEASQPTAVEEAYLKLQAWVDASLDLYRPELQAVLYPMFVHIYLDLMARGFTKEAKRFFSEHSSDYQDALATDLQQLANISTPQHVRENATACMFRENKYMLNMCAYSFDLLVSFLQDNHFMALLKFVNQYLNIKVFSSKPLHLLPEAERRMPDVGVTGHSSQEMTSVNQQALHLGHQKPSDSFFDLVEKTLRSTLDSSTSVDPYLSAYESIKQCRHYNDAPPKEDAAPLPAHTQKSIQAEVESIVDARHCVQLSAKLLPSAIAYTLHNTHNMLTSVSFTEDSTMMATGFYESYIKLWSLTGKGLRTMKSSTEFTAKDFEKSTNYFYQHISKHVVNSFENSLEAVEEPYKKLVGHSGPVYATSFSHDSKFLVSCSEDGTGNLPFFCVAFNFVARLWSTYTHTNLVVYKGHNYPVWDIDFGPESIYFATASHDRTARLWSCEHIYPLRIFTGHLSDVECVRFHPNSNYIATGSADRTARLWDVQRGRCVRMFTGGHGREAAAIMSLAISPDGHKMATGADDGSIAIWDLGSGKLMKRLGQKSGSNTAPPSRRASNTSSPVQSVTQMGDVTFPHAHAASVYSLDFSREGSVLASGSADGTVRIWDMKCLSAPSSSESERYMIDLYLILNAGSPELLQVWRTKRTPVHTVKFTPRNLLLTAGPFVPYE